MREDLASELVQLELRLLDPDIRASRKALGALLAADFVEFGSSGRVYTRDEVIAAVEANGPMRIEASDFSCRLLSSAVAVLNYHSTEANARACLRTSIWQQTDDEWRLVFHQGTPKP
jgi:hypothetical protein